MVENICQQPEGCRTLLEFPINGGFDRDILPKWLKNVQNNEFYIAIWNWVKCKLLKLMNRYHLNWQLLYWSCLRLEGIYDSYDQDSWNITWATKNKQQHQPNKKSIEILVSWASSHNPEIQPRQGSKKKGTWQMGLDPAPTGCTKPGFLWVFTVRPCCHFFLPKSRAETQEGVYSFHHESTKMILKKV